VRAGIALIQKRVMHDIITEGDVDDEFDREYTALSAQVVSLCHGSKRLGLSSCRTLGPAKPKLTLISYYFFILFVNTRTR
jgi:hypothetical protein